MSDDDKPVHSRTELYQLSRQPLGEITERCPHTRRHVDRAQCSICLGVEAVRMVPGDHALDDLPGLRGVRVALAQFSPEESKARARARHRKPRKERL